jgi:hypothetical protein
LAFLNIQITDRFVGLNDRFTQRVFPLGFDCGSSRSKLRPTTNVSIGSLLFMATVGSALNAICKRKRFAPPPGGRYRSQFRGLSNSQRLLESEALIPQMLGMSGRITVGGAWSECSALRTGNDEELQLLVPDRSRGRRSVRGERTRAQFDGLHATSIKP